MRKVVKYLVGALFVVVMAAAGYWGYQSYLAPQPTPSTPQAAPAEEEIEAIPISAEGRVAPIRFAYLSFSAGGLIETVEVSKGDAVSEGEVLARLEGHERLAATVTAAALEHLSAQQALDALYESAHLTAAQYLQAVADARDALRDAERYLNNLRSPAKQTDIDQARANKVLLEDMLEHAREDFEPYADKPESNLTRAALQSRLAQIQKEYDAAVRLLNNLLGSANEIDLAQAEAAYALAQARLSDAQRNYDDWEDGPDADAIALAEARLANARAQLAAAQDALRDLELRAPFFGTLVVSNLKVGEFVAPGAPLVTLADLSAWQVETIDLAESDVGRVAAGMKAAITLDAFPGQTFSAEVVEVSQIGEDRRGDITYTITLNFDPGETPVRWGMTAFVDIVEP